MISVQKKSIGPLFILFGRILFFLFFWANIGIYMGGKELYFGVFMPELEVLFPVSGIGILLIFFGVFIQKKQTFLTWQQYAFLLFLLILFIAQALTSFDSNMSVLFFPLFIVGVLTTVLSDEIRITAKKNIDLLSTGVLLGSLTHMISPESTIIVPLISLSAFFVWITTMRNKAFSTKQQWGTSLGLVILFCLLQDALSLGIYSFLLFIAPLWGPRLYKRARLLQIGFMLIVVGILITGWVLAYWSTSLEIPPYTVGFFDRFFLGTGLGQYMPYLQHQSSIYLSPDELRTPLLGISTWIKEWGIWGILFSTCLGVWNRKWGKIPMVYIVITLIFCIVYPVFSVAENAILFWLLIFLQRGPRKEI